MLCVKCVRVPVFSHFIEQVCVFCVQVFVELNELVIDRNQELQWRETARWIKFEEEVEEETERWGKPHIASLTFRSLLELRKTISHGKFSTGPARWNSLGFSKN